MNYGTKELTEFLNNLNAHCLSLISNLVISRFESTDFNVNTNAFGSLI